MKKMLPMPFDSTNAQRLRTEYVDNIATTTWYTQREEMFNDMFTITPLWDKLNAAGNIKARMPVGRYFEIPITIGKADQNQKWFGRGTVFDEGEKQLWTTLQYFRKNFGDNIVRYKDDEDKNKGRAQARNYARDLVENHWGTMEENLGQACWTASPAADAMNSLPVLFPTTPTTGTIGGIQRSQTTVLQNQATDFDAAYGTPAANLIDAMRTMYNDCSRVKNKRKRRTPDIIVTTQELYELYEDLALASATIEIGKNTGNQRADMGFGNLTFKGAEIFWDPDCPADSMYFLNSSTIELVYDPDNWMEMTEWKTPHNRLDRMAQTYTTLNLVANGFRQNGVLYNITGT